LEEIEHETRVRIECIENDSVCCGDVDEEENKLRLLSEVGRQRDEIKSLHAQLDYNRAASRGLCAEVERLESLLNEAEKMAGFYADANPYDKISMNLKFSLRAHEWLTNLSKYREGKSE
jgi:hypothetical protein